MTLLQAVNYLDDSRLDIPENMSAKHIIEWADKARANDEAAKEQGYNDIEDMCEAEHRPCYNMRYYEPINPHMANR